MSDIHPEPHFLDGKLEEECRHVQTPMECAALSMAISLKRIADAMTEGRFGGFDFETAAERAGQAFALGMRGR